MISITTAKGYKYLRYYFQNKIILMTIIVFFICESNFCVACAIFPYLPSISFDKPFIINGIHLARYLLFYENETMNLLRGNLSYSGLGNEIYLL